jgi:hypothetical protein
MKRRSVNECNLCAAPGEAEECNFLGEALWTRCADFEVHVITKQPSNTSQATVITGFAVPWQRIFFVSLVSAFDKV